VSTRQQRFDRRTFVKRVGTASAGAVLANGVFGGATLADQLPGNSGGVGHGKSFHGPVGLQLYSLRGVLKTSGPLAVLDQARQWGFRHVEASDLGGLTPVQYKAELDRRNLTPIGKMFSYDRLQNDIGGVIAEATNLGLRYVGCAYILHKKPFDEQQCRAAATVFNRAGRALAECGMKFYFHNHGYEFVPHADGTLFDLLAAETDPRLVCFEMDVLWTVQPGQDPVKLLEKYPNRWLLMHLKDLGRGVPTGSSAGKTALTDDVALGTGQVDWPSLLRTSQTVGVKQYFIEDESPNAVEQVPRSLRFLEQIEF
jgi:sugar phosphate isomerase/epimerase